MSQFLERESFIEILKDEFVLAHTESGCIVRVAGNAGIGKTSLLEHFVATLPDHQMLWGNCEAPERDGGRWRRR